MPKLPFGFEKPEDSPGFLLWQTTVIWQRLIKEALDEYKISHSQFVIMATLLWFEKHDYNTNQSSISSWTKLDKMTVSKSLKKLILIKMVNQKESLSDSRANSISLTILGKKLIHKLIPIVEETDKLFFGKISEKNQKKLIAALNLLTKTN